MTADAIAETEVFHAGEAAVTCRLPTYAETAHLAGVAAGIWRDTAEPEQSAA